MFRQFESVTQCVLRYCELWRLSSTTRSIPLGTKKTHVGKTDSRRKWQDIEEELCSLITVFPKSDTREWYLLAIEQATNLMPRDRLQLFNDKTGEGWSKYRFDRATDQAYRDLGFRLRERGWLVDGRSAENS